MDIYPIHPGDRLQSRIVAVLTADLLPLSAFTGFSAVNDRISEETALPWLAVRVTESIATPPNSFVHSISIVVQMLEDRTECNTTIGADTRPRHELRAENLSARLFGRWNGSTLTESVNAISNGQGIYVAKTSGQQVTQSNDVDQIGTEYTFTMLCAATQQ